MDGRASLQEAFFEILQVAGTADDLQAAGGREPRTRAILQEFKAALVQLRERPLPGPVEVDVRLRAVILRAAPREVRVTKSGEPAHTPGHPQVRLAILGRR